MLRDPYIIYQVDGEGNTGYDYLNKDSKKRIAEYIDKNKLNVPKPVWGWF